MKRINSEGAIPRLGIITGLASEAVVATALIGDNGFPARIVCAGASNERAAALAQELVESGVAALLSFGIAGALDPALASGDLIVARELRDEGGHLYPCDAAWQEALHAALVETRIACRRAAILGSRRLWRRPEDKRAQFAATGCSAVDMESGAVAAIAAAAGLPFLCVRAVADRADDLLPPLAETAVKPDGMPAIGRTLAAMLLHPGQIPATLRLARRGYLALASLRRLEPVRNELLGGF